MHDRGVVVIASDPFGKTPRRPYLIASHDGHPFAGEQYIALGITTREYQSAVSLAGSFATGSLDRDSFVAPWAIVSLRDLDVHRAVARLESTFVDSVVEEMTEYVRSTSP